MNKYLHILNWCMVTVVILTWFYLKPIFGVAIFWGAIVGGMLSAGFVSWQYHKDATKDKDDRWRSLYFNKKYIVEVPTQIVATAVFLGVSLLFWHGFFAFLGGLVLMWSFNIVIEALWYFTVVKRYK